MHNLQYRPCERCEITVDENEFGIQDDFGAQSPPPHPMCSESQIAHGVLCWLCYKCRQDWIGLINNHQLTREYSKASLVLDHWKTLLVATGVGDIADGQRFLAEIDRLDDELTEFARSWVKNREIRE